MLLFPSPIMEQDQSRTRPGPIDIPPRPSHAFFASHQSYDDLEHPLGTEPEPDHELLGQQTPVFSSPRKRLSGGRLASYTPITRSGPSDSNRDRHPEQQWSLFGQLMENEGYLSPTSASFRGRRDSGNYFFSRDTTSTASGLSARAHGSLAPSYTHQDVSIRTASPIRSSVLIEPTSDEYDSDRDSIQATTRAPPPPQSPQPWWANLPTGRLSLSSITKNVLKCSMAYFIASLFTFSPFLSAIFTDVDSSTPSASAHMVSTMYV